MMASTLVCVLCGARYPLEDRFRCDCDPGSLLEFRPEIPRFKKVAVQKPRLKARSISGVWKYHRVVLPDLPYGEIVSRGEGFTRMYRFARTSAWTDVPNLAFKHEGENPTGSFKDRGMTVAVSWAKHRGAETIACASTGNTAASVASYAALAGLQALLIVPEKATALGKISQSLAYGAKTMMVRGDFDDCLRLLLEAKDELGFAIMNSVNPYRLEGQKTIMFEMLDQLSGAGLGFGWSDPPDWVVVPGGNLGNAAAFGKAFIEAHDAGWIPRMPRLAVVQAEGASPFFRSFADDWRTYAPMTPETVATAIRIGAPVNVPKARRAIEATNGVVTCVTDAQIMEAKAVLDSDGVGAEPAACASAAGIRRLRGEGVIKKDDRVVGVLTGHVLKDPDATIGFHSGTSKEGHGNPRANPPVVIDPTLSDLERAITRFS